MVSGAFESAIPLRAAGILTWGQVSKARGRKKCGTEKRDKKEEEAESEKHFLLQLININLHTCLDSKMTKI